MSAVRQVYSLGRCRGPGLAYGPRVLISSTGRMLQKLRFQTVVEATMAIFDYIEAWYEPRRRLSNIGWVPRGNIGGSTVQTET